MSTVKIKGELFWSKWMENFNTAFNQANDRYECVIGNLSDADCEKLKSLGIKIKNKEIQGNHIVAKSKFVFEPKTSDGKLVTISDIGNGTEVEAGITAYTHPMSKLHGNAPSVKYLVVTNLKEYVPEDKEEKKVAVTDIDDDDIL